MIDLQLWIRLIVIVTVLAAFGALCFYMWTSEDAAKAAREKVCVEAHLFFDPHTLLCEP
jgi:flagellar basal body-associated protein FliL